jgi:hypothetical protein
MGKLIETLIYIEQTTTLCFVCIYGVSFEGSIKMSRITIVMLPFVNIDGKEVLLCDASYSYKMHNAVYIDRDFTELPRFIYGRVMAEFLLRNDISKLKIDDIRERFRCDEFQDFVEKLFCELLSVDVVA